MPKPLTLQRPQGQFSAILHGETGPLVVCLHGFPDNYHSFDALLPTLLEAGYRVLTPVMRGYEPSSVQTDANYAVLQLAEDVIAWLDFLGEERVFLIGHDWGAVTGWTAAALAPQRFHAFVSLAIPHLGGFLPGLKTIPSQLLYSWYMTFFQLRGLADWAVKQNDWALIRLLWRRWSPNWEAPESLLRSVISTFEQPGVASAALGYYRSMFRLWSAESKRALALSQLPIKVPSLVLAGADDGCISPDMFELCMASVRLPGFVEDQQLPGLGHFLHLEDSVAVITPILGFFYRWRVTGNALAQ